MNFEINIKWLVTGIILLLVTLFAVPNLVETLDAKDVMVIQNPISGELTVHTEPGPKWQGFGRVTTYPRQRQYVFDVDPDTGRNTSIQLQFNDGGKADLFGSVNWEMPVDRDSIIKIHKQFNSAEGVEKRAVVKMLDAATYLAGPLMSSIESVGERRSELVNVINDQATRGVYVTRVVSQMVKDELTGDSKLIDITEIQRNKDGTPKRQQGSILEDFNIVLQPISIKHLKYDDEVENQIKTRQKATNAVQLSIADALKAVQDAITTEERGKASAAEAKWKQETIKAQQITEAEQKREVAKLAKEEAEFYKQQQILIGQGDAEKRRLLIEADGALNPKLEAYIQVQQYWADAFSKFGGSMVPSVVMGGEGQNKTSVGGAAQLVDLLTAKTAQDLALDKSVTGKK